MNDENYIPLVYKLSESDIREIECRTGWKIGCQIIGILPIMPKTELIKPFIGVNLEEIKDE